MHACVSSKGLSRTALSAATMVMVASLLAGCGTVAREPVTRQLPAPPEYLRPEPVPPATKGKSAFVVSEERAAVIQRQNIIIVSARSAWQKMKDTYAKSYLHR